jgi:UDP-glucose 4-epimerase
VTVVDNLENSYVRSLDHVRQLVGAEVAQGLRFVQADVRDAAAMDRILSDDTNRCGGRAGGH